MARSARLERLMLVLVASFVASLAYLLATRRYGFGSVLRVALFADVFLIAAMTAAMKEPDVYALAYFWPIGLSAFLLGPRDTAGVVVLCCLCAGTVPFAYDGDAVTVVTDIVVIALVGGLLALLSHQTRLSERQVARDRAYDGAALRIAERVRSSVALEDVLRLTVEELGRAVDVARSLLRRAPDTAGPGLLYEWDREGVPPLQLVEPPQPVRRVFDTQEPLVVGSPEEADDEVRRYLASVGMRALIAYPIVWHGRVITVLGFHDDRDRDWQEEALPLVERVTPQIAAALAQAELFEQQQRALARLEEITRLREELVANVSHEFRTPLTSTIGFLRTLERPDLRFEEEERMRFLAIARSEAERLARMVDDCSSSRASSAGRPTSSSARCAWPTWSSGRSLTFPHRRDARSRSLSSRS